MPTDTTAARGRHARAVRDAAADRRARGHRQGPRPRLPDEVRHRIYAERQAGRTLWAIVEGLKADGVPTARGGQWWPATVRHVVASVERDLAAAEARGLSLDRVLDPTERQDRATDDLRGRMRA